MAENTDATEVEIGLTADTASANDDAVLHKLLGEPVDDLSMPGGDVLDAKEEFVPGAEGPPGDTDKTPAPEPAAEKTTPDEEAFRLAAAVLRRDGLKAEDVALLPRERVLALGEARAKVQNDTDSAYAELVTLRTGTPPVELPGSKNDAEAPPAQTVDPLAAIAPIAEQLALDDEGAAALAKWQQSIQEPLQAQLAQQQTAINEAVKVALRMEADTARRDLSERFTQLQDASGDAYKRTLNRMTVLQQGGAKYDSTVKLMEDAYMVEFAADIKQEASEAQKKLRTARANGNVTTQTTEPQATRTESNTLSVSEREDQALALLMGDGDSRPYEERMAAARKLSGT